jgi:hypothetical protein
MTGHPTLAAAALISAISATSALADEPAAFQAQFPNRDVLNGGALTPAGRLGLELPGGAAGNDAATNAYAGTGGASRSFRALRHRSHDRLGRVLARAVRLRLTFELAGRHRPPEQMALRKIHAQHSQPFELLSRLHAFGGDADVEARCERHRRGDDRRTLVKPGQIGDERLVDLDLVKRERGQAAPRRIAGAEIVERQRNPDAFEFLTCATPSRAVSSRCIISRSLIFLRCSLFPMVPLPSMEGTPGGARDDQCD